MSHNLGFDYYALKKVHLISNEQIVGEAIIYTKEKVIYHLWKTMQITREDNFAEISKKYKLAIKQ